MNRASTIGRSDAHDRLTADIPIRATDRRPDLAARLLELGLAAFVVVAPIPFGAVPAAGRLTLELSALLLLVLWAIRALFRPTPMPSTLALVGVLSLLAFAALQSAPLGSTIVGTVSPAALEVRSMSLPPPAVSSAEEKILGIDPRGLDTVATLSVDPTATASALRTGTALGAVFLVACTVAATCGGRTLAVALLTSASLQGLYGLLVLTSDDPHIWHVAKRYYLNSATGTFVNRNHFACFLAMTTACGMALILSNASRAHRPSRRSRILHLFSGANSRNLALGILLIVALAGLMTSLSRAGIALALLAMSLTVLFAGRSSQLRPRVLVGLLVVATATVPLVQIGFGSLVNRFSNSSQDFWSSGGRVTVWQDTLSLATQFPVVGSGYGTFAYAYPIARAPEVRLFYAHAHNDILQVAAEGGFVGLVFLILLLVPTLRNVVHTLAGEKGILAVGFAAGLTAMLLHSLVDFNFHIPANAAMAAVLAGTLEGLPWKRNRST